MGAGIAEAGGPYDLLLQFPFTIEASTRPNRLSDTFQCMDSRSSDEAMMMLALDNDTKWTATKLVHKVRRGMGSLKYMDVSGTDGPPIDIFDPATMQRIPRPPNTKRKRDDKTWAVHDDGSIRGVRKPGGIKPETTTSKPSQRMQDAENRRRKLVATFTGKPAKDVAPAPVDIDEETVDPVAELLAHADVLDPGVLHEHLDASGFSLSHGTAAVAEAGPPADDPLGAKVDLPSWVLPQILEDFCNGEFDHHYPKGPSSSSSSTTTTASSVSASSSSSSTTSSSTTPSASSASASASAASSSSTDPYPPPPPPPDAYEGTVLALGTIETRNEQTGLCGLVCSPRSLNNGCAIGSYICS